VAAWHNFFVAAAALSGLIFVAVSINLRTILDQEKEAGSSYLTGRALESLAALLVVLGISLVGLDPSVSRVVFAAVLLTCTAGSCSASSWPSPSRPPTPGSSWSRSCASDT
jgi:hypothetical protein